MSFSVLLWVTLFSLNFGAGTLRIMFLELSSGVCQKERPAAVVGGRPGRILRGILDFVCDSHGFVPSVTISRKLRMAVLFRDAQTARIRLDVVVLTLITRRDGGGYRTWPGRG
jgi:hypothetical protein